MFSKAVLTVKDLVMPTGLRRFFHSSFGTALADSSYSGMKSKLGRTSNDVLTILTDRALKMYQRLFARATGLVTEAKP